MPTDEMNTKLEELQSEITGLKNLLEQSDYNCNKLIESFLSTVSDSTAVNLVANLIGWALSATREFQDILTKRADYRKRINELEEEIATLDE